MHMHQNKVRKDTHRFKITNTTALSGVKNAICWIPLIFFEVVSILTLLGGTYLQGNEINKIN